VAGQIWNPDTNSDYTPRAFEGGDRDEGGVGLHDTLCGQSLEQVGGGKGPGDDARQARPRPESAATGLTGCNALAG